VEAEADEAKVVVAGEVERRGWCWRRGNWRRRWRRRLRRRRR